MQNSQNVKDIILAATVSGYFRVKTDEKKEAALLEVFDALPELEGEYIRGVLLAESIKRSEANRKRMAAKVERDHAADNKPVSGGYHEREIPVLEGNAFIVTVAQNNTDIHSEALSAMLTLAQGIGARLVVCKTYYNKQGFQHPEHGSDAEGIYFDPALSAYFVDAPCILGNSGALLVANANVIPTAKWPLNGFADMGKAGQDVIIPAVRIGLECTPALKGSQGKRLFATGAVTLKNYIQRKAGQVAENSHNIGALVVSVGDIRHVEIMPNANGFYYGNEYYHNGIVDIFPDAVAALQFGDIHAEKATSANLEKAADLIRHYKPKNVILHDLMDFASRNHHNVKDCGFIFRQHQEQNSVVQDCNKVIQVLDQLQYAGDSRLIVIESNHDLALERWLKEADFKDDPVNAEFYLAAMLAYYQSIRFNGSPHNVLRNTLVNLASEISIHDGYGNVLEGIDPDSAEFLGTDESLIIAGIEMGNHGHNGANGSKGSPKQFAKLGVPMNTGHTHTPSIYGTCYTAGVTGSLEMGYNVGPSSWREAHILTYENGQRAIIFG